MIVFLQNETTHLLTSKETLLACCSHSSCFHYSSSRASQLTVASSELLLLLYLSLLSNFPLLYSFLPLISNQTPCKPALHLPPWNFSFVAHFITADHGSVLLGMQGLSCVQSLGVFLSTFPMIHFTKPRGRNKFAAKVTTGNTAGNVKNRGLLIYISPPRLRIKKGNMLDSNIYLYLFLWIHGLKHV